MERRTIGSLQVTVVGMGCNNFGRRLDEGDTATVVNAALEADINFFDTADVYGDGRSEEYLGRALGARRHDVVVATKFGGGDPPRGASPTTIRASAEASLQRLSSDYIDLYQLHNPDPHVPIGETLGALDELVQQGKVREIGCSNFSLAQLREANAAVKERAARFASVQNEYSLLHREPEREVLPYCEQQGLAFLPYFPLASGLLTGKYRQGEPLPEGTRITTNPSSDRWLNETNLTRAEALIAFAEVRGHTILELAFSWLLRWGSVASVIAGAMSSVQVQTNVSAPTWRLSADELLEIDAILTFG